MIRSAVTVSLVHEARGGPFVYWHDLPGACRSAKSLGFDAVEVFPPAPDAVDPGTLRKLIDETGLALAAVGTGAGWVRQKLHLCLPDAVARQKARTYIRAIIDFAGPFGAPAIIGSMQGRYGDEVDQPTAMKLLAEALEDLGEHARQYQVPLIFEPINRYESNLINSIDAGMTLVRPLSTKNVVLLADLFHMNIEEIDTAAALRAGGSLIGHVHFVDSNRRPAGMGHIDYRPIVAALEAIGYNRFAAAEALPYPDPEAAARQTILAFRKYFRSQNDRPHQRETVLIESVPTARSPVQLSLRAYQENRSMLKHQLIHPKINEILGRAGHHATILIADGHFPASTKKGPNAELVSLNLMPGVVTCAQALQAVVSAVPIDAVNTMMYTKDDAYALDGDPPAWDEYRAVLRKAGLALELTPIDKWAFYDAVATTDHVLTIQTADMQRFANILLSVGVRME